MGKGSEKAPDKATTFSAEQGKETEHKLILSVRSSLDALPLRNPFDVASLEQGGEKKASAAEEKETKRVTGGKKGTGETLSKEVQRAVQEAPQRRTVEYRITGVIQGEHPLVLLECGGETEIYGVGEGPVGHRITSITDHEAYGEGGLYYQY